MAKEEEEYILRATIKWIGELRNGQNTSGICLVCGAGDVKVLDRAPSDVDLPNALFRKSRTIKWKASCSMPDSSPDTGECASRTSFVVYVRL